MPPARAGASPAPGPGARCGAAPPQRPPMAAWPWRPRPRPLQGEAARRVRPSRSAWRPPRRANREGLHWRRTPCTGAEPARRGGRGGGIAQVSVMGPCTYLVTGAVNDPSGKSSIERIRETYARAGVKGFYPGGTAIAFRQATNWASRQGFTEIVREKAKAVWYPDVDSKEVKMTKGQEVVCGVIGGTMACWNHPFEVARIEAQTRGSLGQETGSMVSVMKDIIKENGVGGLFRGIVPRIGLGIWQTLFMVTGAKILKEELKERGLLEGSSSSGGH